MSKWGGRPRPHPRPPAAARPPPPPRLAPPSARAPQVALLQPLSTLSRVSPLAHNGTIPALMPNTKIVATLGPASDSPPAIRQLLLAGVDVFRLNASHSTQAEHAARIAAIRQVAAELGRPASIL